MKKAILFFCVTLLFIKINAQVGIGTATPDASAQLDITSTNKGLLIPRVFSFNRPASPVAGLLIYQVDGTPGFYYYNGSSWQLFGWGLNGNAGTTASNFIGTTDFSALIFKVNNLQSGYLHPFGFLTSFGIQTGINNIGTRNSFFGYQAGMNNTNGNDNLAFGYKALLSNQTGASNVAIGTQALSSNISGFSNVAIGEGALSANTNSDNTAVGRLALNKNVSGTGNVYMGTQSGTNGTSGNNNTAIGYSSMQNNLNGNFNTALGSYTLNSGSGGSYNTAIGNNAARLMSGDHNTSVGNVSLQNNTTGSFNTAIGDSALFYIGSGSNNTALGYGAGPFNGFANLQNTTAIGYNATVFTNNTIRLGDINITGIFAQVGITATSDKRFKFNIKENVEGLNFIMKLRPVTYQFNTKALDEFTAGNTSFASYNPKMEASYKASSSIRHTGFIAQEVETIAQQTGYDFDGLHKPENERDHYGLNYASFVVPLVKAVQEQQKQIEKLDKENEELKKELLNIHQLLEKMNTNK